MKHFSTLLMICLLFFSGTGMAQEQQKKGRWIDYHEDNTLRYSMALPTSNVVINSLQDLADIARAIVNNHATYEGFTITLNTDLDLSQMYWDPWGANPNQPFKGTFNGNGHTIKGIEFDPNMPYMYTGFFGYINGAVIKNFNAGGTVSVNSASAANGIGLIVGSGDNSLIINSSSSGTVSNTGTAGHVGGLIGINSSNNQVVNCYNLANVSGPNSSSVGGIAGLNEADATIRNCYSVAIIEGGNKSTMGGLVGINKGTVKAVYFKRETINGAQNTTGVAMQGTAMQTVEFVHSLDNEAALYNNDAVNVKACAWKYNSSTYPTLNIAELPQADNNWIYYRKEPVKTGGTTVTITTAEELAWIAWWGQTYDTQYAETIFLGADINLSGKEWTPIAGTTAPVLLDGKGYRISGISVSSNVDNAGLFATLQNATVINLSLSADFQINGKAGIYVGALAGKCENCTILNCGVFMDNRTTSDLFVVGGITGSANNTSITNSYTEHKIMTGHTVGGIVGKMTGTSSLTNCYSWGMGESKEYGGVCGGVVGTTDSKTTITNGYWCKTYIPEGIGTDNGVSQQIVGMENSEMIKETFAATLNANAAAYNQNATLKACAWAYKTNIMPTLDFGNLPVGGKNHWIDYYETPQDISGPVIIINKPTELAWVIYVVNIANDPLIGKIIQLGGDIDLGGHDWIPIGTSQTPFGGHFVGGGHRITNITFDLSGGSGGFFGTTGSTAIIDYVWISPFWPLTVIPAQPMYLGGLAGVNNGTIINCWVSADLAAPQNTHLGGMAGENNGTIVNCFVTGNLTGQTSHQTGGIAALNSNEGVISNCYVSGKVSGGYEVSGPIAGINAGKIENGYWNKDNNTSTATNGMTAAEMQRDAFATTLNNNAYTYNNTQPAVQAWAWKINPAISSFPTFNRGVYPPAPSGKGHWIDYYEEPDDISGPIITLNKPGHLGWLIHIVNIEHNPLNGKTIVLGGHIDLGGHDWIPVGTKDYPFGGHFDGGGYQITNITFDGSFDGFGFFGHIGEGGLVHQVDIYWSTEVTGTLPGNISYFGGIAGWNEGTIINCSVNYNLIAGGLLRIGGIAGKNNGKIINCYNQSRMSATGSAAVGGLVADNYGTISNSYVSGSISSTQGTQDAIALTTNNGTISHCYYNESAGNTSTVPSGTALTADAMKATDFVNTLNTNAYSYNQTSPAVKALAWQQSDDFPVFHLGVYPSGKGHWIDYYEKPSTANESTIIILTSRHLAWVLKEVYSGNTFRGKTIRLGAHIDLSERYWIAIGSMWGTLRGVFEGTFDGNHYKIIGITCQENDRIAGLFGYINGAKLINIHIECNIQTIGLAPGQWTQNDVLLSGGLVAGANNSYITNCFVGGTIASTYGMVAGGLVGASVNCVIYNCHTDVTIRHALSGGGLVGNCTGGKVINCHSRGTLSDSQAGGFVGYHALDAGATIFQYCYWDMTVNAGLPAIGQDENRSTGGLTGMTTAQLEATDCLTLLNTNAYNFNLTGPVCKGWMWISGTDGFPALQFGTYPPAPVQVAIPVFTPLSTTFSGTLAITINCSTTGAKIYYTTDGTVPTTASRPYTGSITLTATTTVRAIAVKNGLIDSPVATAIYRNDADPTGMEQIETDACRIYSQDGKLFVDTDPQSQVILYAPDGTCIRRTTTASTQTCIEGLRQGIYVVRWSKDGIIRNRQVRINE